MLCFLSASLRSGPPLDPHPHQHGPLQVHSGPPVPLQDDPKTRPGLLRGSLAPNLHPLHPHDPLVPPAAHLRRPNHLHPCLPQILFPQLLPLLRHPPALSRLHPPYGRPGLQLPKSLQEDPFDQKHLGYLLRGLEHGRPERLPREGSNQEAERVEPLGHLHPLA